MTPLFFEVKYNNHCYEVAMIDNDYKLIKTIQKNRFSRKPADYLFDISKDRKEADNLAKKNPAKFAAMLKQIEVWQKSVNKDLRTYDNQVPEKMRKRKK